MVKARIVERTRPDGTKQYAIQQRHFLFFWHWVDAWVNSGADRCDTFNTFEKAKENLCWFDGTKWTDRVVQEGL